EASTFTVSVEEPPAVTEVGLSVVVGPAGETLADRVTVSGTPLVTAVLIVEVPLPPITRPSLRGRASIAESAVAGCVTGTVRLVVTGVLGVARPWVPVRVSVWVLVARVEPTLTVGAEGPPAVTGVGFNVAVGPAGETLAVRFTAPAVPLVTAVLIVEVPLL